jgi:PBP1b-binding outer membrane lipoprotein LpoB
MQPRNMKTHYTIRLLALFIIGCASTENTTNYNCSYSTGKTVNSTEEAKQAAIECFNHLGIKNYIAESAKVQIIDSTVYEVVFNRSDHAVPSTYALTVSVSNGCVIIIPQK